MKSLDSKDRLNKQIKNDLKTLPGLEGYEEFLSLSTDVFITALILISSLKYYSIFNRTFVKYLIEIIEKLIIH